MNKHLYLILYPVDALVASQLEPTEFARHFSVGSAKHFEGKTIFVEIDPAFRSPGLPVEEALAQTVPHPDGTPKRTKYVSMYNTLSRVDLSAVGDLFLVTVDGLALKIKKSAAVEPRVAEPIHVFHLMSPLSFPIACKLSPIQYARYITKESQFKRLPKVSFAELDVRASQIAEAGTPPEVTPIPNTHRVHVWNSLKELASIPGKKTKTLSIQDTLDHMPFLSWKNGVWISDGELDLFFALPAKDTLKYDYPDWYRSA